MEKLQRAMEKARRERKGRSSTGLPSSGAAVEPGQTEQDAAVAARWQAMNSFTPDADHLQRHRVTTLNAQPAMNPFDMLRTKIFLLMRSNKWTRLAITSPTKSCGKTTTACNLAAGFSRQRELRSMLFDTDLRKPAVAKTMGHTPQHGLQEVLTGDIAPEEQMVRLRDNVALAMTNRAVIDPTQLLLSDQAVQVLQDIEDSFQPDLMIFDLPPMLATDDARAFLKNVDCALIVARAEQTKVSHLDICEREVAEQTNVLGVILNDCRLASKSKVDAYEEY